ncbi:hypothetical protein [Phenylobacterium sp.]|uniref:hypothetical protein n=1 Tax=Phenylobacterium sp. TaxID=1871053 RepID=UPI0027363B70|nr:hypothetical protein [Phenylobacterium sp.]MDP3853133.1 hypothetical protein [Phenylobacterium sp.]
MAFQNANEAYEASLRNTTIGLCIEKGWKVMLTCSTCGHGGKMGALLNVDQLREMEQQMTMAELARRATFSCGHSGAWVDHRQDRAATHVGEKARIAAWQARSAE